MSRHLHLDPLSGASGDMWLAMLVDLGLEPGLLEGLPARLGLEDVRVVVSRTKRGALDAARVEVLVGGVDPDAPGSPSLEHDHAHDHGRSFAALVGRIERAELPAPVIARARRVFEALFEAESRVHGKPVEALHLHEAGADDALVDIVGACLGVHALGIESISCATPLPLGGGTVKAAHGVLPVPPPAVALLLEGVEVVGGPVPRELVTPTGAALLRVLVDAFGPLPALRVERAGHGAGRRNDPTRPNVLRGLLGARGGAPIEREIAVLEAAIDDMLPQDLPPLIERLLEEGALDALVLPAQMKKGRPAFRLEVVAEPTRARELAELILRASTTLGVRIDSQRRVEWRRDLVDVDTPWGRVKVKRALDGRGGVVRTRAEFEEARAAAERAKVRIDEVRRAAEQAAEEAAGQATEQAAESDAGKPAEAGRERASEEDA